MNSDLQNNTFIGFLDPKNIGKEVAFIILACFVILHYISSSHFEKTAKKHVFTRGILLYFFLVISKTPRRQNQQKSFDLEFFPRLGYFGLRCLQYKDFMHTNFGWIWINRSISIGVLIFEMGPKSWYISVLARFFHMYVWNMCWGSPLWPCQATNDSVL